MHVLCGWIDNGITTVNQFYHKPPKPGELPNWKIPEINQIILKSLDGDHSKGIYPFQARTLIPILRIMIILVKSGSIKQLNKWYSDTFYKIDSINSHIDKVVVEASKKLVVTVSVSKADRVAIQADHDRWIQEMNAIHNRDLKELNEKYERERQNRRDMLNGGDGMYLSGFMYWIGCAFFWFGVSALFVLVYCLIR